MALEPAFQILGKQLGLLKEAVDELQLNLNGDYYPESRFQPLIDGHAAREPAPLPVQQLADRVSELQGAVEEAQNAAVSAERTVQYPRNLAETRLALIAIQRCLNGALKTYLEEVSTYQAAQTLILMGRRKGGKWPEWVKLLKTVIEACRVPLHEAFRAVSECWEELTDKLSANSVLVQTTNIGQQIRPPGNPVAAVNKFP
jgi:hypothetical protein